MEVKEIGMMLEMIRVAYPKYAQHLSESEKAAQVMLWQSQFRDYDANIVSVALNDCIGMNEFPPSIAEIKKRVDALTQPSKEELWVTLMQAARRSVRTDYEADGKGSFRRVFMKGEEYKNLPTVLQRYVVSPSGLYDLHYEIKDNPMMARARFDKRIDAIREDVKTDVQKERLKIASNIKSIGELVHDIT